MATHKKKKKDNNLETFSLLWLDGEVNTNEENKSAQRRLRTIINQLKTFQDSKACKKYIKSFTEQDRIILIVSGRLSKELIPEIHHLRQLSSVYIYCWDKKAYKRWAKDFSKVKGVLNHLDDLIEKIISNQKSQAKTEEPMALNVYNASTNIDKSTTELNGNFIHYQLLIDVLVRMETNEADKKKLINFCEEEYSDNDTMLAVIRDFERDYRPKKVLWWYTRDTFLYNLLNKALRTQNTEVLLLFRFIIRDIYEQLKRNQYKEPITVYRYQKMSMEELQNLQESVGQFISINSFFSTTSDRSVALNFSNSAQVSNDLHAVLFVIEANPRVVKTKPFADISLLSYFVHECEFLFMVGCIFRITDVHHNENEKIWTIKMYLADDEDDHDLEGLFKHFKKQFVEGENKVGLQTYGDVLHKMGKHDAAMKVYNDLHDVFSSDDSSYSHLCFSLGKVHKDRKDFDRSLRWFQTALDRKVRSEPSEFVYIAGLHCSMANVYLEKSDYDQAMKSFNRAFDCYKRGNALAHPDVASLHHGIARILCAQKKYQESFHHYERSLKMQQEHLPANHPDMALNFSGIGDVYYNAGQYQRAMESYIRALEIRNKSLPPDHLDLANNNKNIGQVYEAVNRLKDALTYYQISQKIYRKALPASDSSVIEIDKCVQRVTAKLK